MNLTERLLLCVLLGALTLGLAALARRRGLPRPPLRLMLLGIVLWAAFEGVTPSGGMRWLAALDELGMAYALIGLGVWLLLECPPALGWCPPGALILRDLTRIGLGSLATVLVLQNRAQLNLVGLVATSAVLTAVLGLAAQEIIKDLFAGIELQLDPPFQVGDWIEIGDKNGVVESLDLMTTTLRRVDNSTMLVPNSMVVDSPLRRFTSNEAVGNRFTVALGFEVPPGQAHELLESVLQRHPLVLENPAPIVWVSKFDESRIDYELLAFHRNGAEGSRMRIRSELLEQIWYTVQRQGWSLPFPSLQLQKRPEALPPVIQDASATSQVLRRSWLFSQLEQAQVERLAQRVHWNRFGPGETIVRQGDAGTALFQVVQGTVEVFMNDGSAEGLAVSQLGTDELFGEMGLCTGEPRSATVRSRGECVLLEVNRADLLPMLEEDPSVLDQLSLIVATRRSELERLSSKDAEERRSSILRRMRDLFGLAQS